MALQEIMQRSMNVITGGRALALFHATISDATIATWTANVELQPAAAGLCSTGRSDRRYMTPNSPSYPSEHTRLLPGAASEVLAYLFPDRADFYKAKAVEAGETFLSAGTQYRSDVEDGLALGRQVAQLAIERAMNDGSTAQWDGQMPTGPGYWTRSRGRLLQPWAARRPGRWRLAASFGPARPRHMIRRPWPPRWTSCVTSSARRERMHLPYFWEWGAGGPTQPPGSGMNSSTRSSWNIGSMTNPPRAARAYALKASPSTIFVACWDAKYTYWAFRPFQYIDRDRLRTLFATPNHPSYPSAHSCLSGAVADVLGVSLPTRSQPVHPDLAAQAGRGAHLGRHPFPQRHRRRPEYS